MHKFSFESLRRHPVVIGILSIIFFPLGLFLVWTQPDWKKKTQWIWTGVIALFALAAIARRDESATSRASASAGGSARANSETKEPHQLGETFVLGHYKYRIDAVRTTKQLGRWIGPHFMGARAADGAVLVIVSYTIENTSPETQTVLSDDFQVVDAAGRKFRPSTEANVALLHESDDKDFVLSELQPGIPRSMKQAFEVPEASLAAPFTLVIPEKGLWSSGAARVVVPAS